MDPRNILISYSLALYSTWFYHKPTRCLFDAGEGVATAMGKKVFAIQHIFLTHGHEDHIAGISNLINIRNVTSGEEDKPLTLYYPVHDRWIDALLEYIEKKQSGLLRYPLYAQPLEVGDEVEIEVTKRPTRARAFEMKHAKGQLCLGYELEQERKIIDPVTGESIYRYWPIFLYTGDGYEVCHTPYGRVDVAIHEATFLARDVSKASAWQGSRHSTVDDAVEWGASEDVKTLILSHISDRYSLEEVIAAAEDARRRSGFRGDLYIACKDEIYAVGGLAQLQGEESSS